MVDKEPAELVKALAPLEGAQTSFQILHLSAASRLSHLHYTAQPSITRQAAADYDAFVEWVLASVIAGDGVTTAGLSTPEEVAHDRNVCQNQTHLGHEALRQAHLSIEKGGLGLTSSNSIKGVAYIGCHVFFLGRVVAASTRGDLLSLLERLREGPTASALLEKTMATKFKRGQIEDAVGTSGAALVAEDDSQGRGIGSVLVEAGAEREGVRGGVDGRGEGGLTATTMGRSVSNPA